MNQAVTAKLSYLRMSPRKVRLLTNLIRGMKTDKAILQLEVQSKEAARPVLKLLQSAIANAKHNDGLKEDTLKVERIFVDGGPILHRWKPKAMGRATPIKKRTSHITIVVSGEVDEKAVVKTEKTKEKKIESTESADVVKTEKANAGKLKKDDKKKKVVKKVEKKVEAKKESK